MHIASVKVTIRVHRRGELEQFFTGFNVNVFVVRFERHIEMGSLANYEMAKQFLRGKKKEDKKDLKVE